jgi:hypothetical protein
MLLVTLIIVHNVRATRWRIVLCGPNGRANMHMRSRRYFLSFILVVWAHKAILAPRPFLIYCASVTVFQSFQICPPELPGNFQQRHLVAKQEKLDEEMAVECLVRSISFKLVGFFNLTTWDWRFYFPSEESRATGFYRPLKSVVTVGFELANLGSNGKHANHYTTEGDSLCSY